MRAPYSPVRLIYGKNSKIGHSLPYSPVRLIVRKIRYTLIAPYYLTENDEEHRKFDVHLYINNNNNGYS